LSFDPTALVESKGLAERPFSVSRLKGGAWNDVFRIRSDKADIVIKRFVNMPEGSLFPNLPHGEALALERLSGLAVAPEPVAFYPETEWGAALVYQFHPGKSWDGNVLPVAQLQKRKLGVDTSGFREVPIDCEGILAQGDALFARCENDHRVEAFRKYRPKARAFAPLGRRVLIHTDVGPTNLIDGPQGVRLIDWQCPAAGDPAEDVASFLAPALQILSFRAPLSLAERMAFLAEYADPAMQERLAVLEPCYVYRMAGYSCLRYQLLKDSDPMWHDLYIKAADAELERFKENIF
jgi:hypothetical protein